MSALISADPWRHDPAVVEIPWRSAQLGSAGEGTPTSGKLCLAILEFDGLVTPHPPIMRGIRIVRDALERAGHSVSSIAFVALDF